MVPLCHGKSSPLYEFGYGLSYTTFDISPITLSANEMGVNGSINAKVDVTNTSQMTEVKLFSCILEIVIVR